mmetsp:Transcript_416/g.605  ORF Transcript_416/g.605 Transcript_416/m.605 type:complete len:120 (-) Transcript_416:50-409(-)
MAVVVFVVFLGCVVVLDDAVVLDVVFDGGGVVVLTIAVVLVKATEVGGGEVVGGELVVGADVVDAGAVVVMRGADVVMQAPAQQASWPQPSCAALLCGAANPAGHTHASMPPMPVLFDI